MPKKIWVILLGLFLLVYGLVSISNFTFQFQGVILGFLAVLAAIFLFLDR